MSEKNTRLTILFQKYVTNSCSSEELQEFWKLMQDNSDDNALLVNALTWWNDAGDNQAKLSEKASADLLNRILSDKGKTELPKEQTRAVRSTLIRRISIAASVAAVFCLLWLGINRFGDNGAEKSNYPMAKVENPLYKNDVLPGTNAATLTLDNGTVVVLDSNGNKSINEAGAEVAVLKGSTLEYVPLPNKGAVYNTLSTGYGQQYQVRLSDGTLVVLDAGSSVRYPVSFADSQRVVSITGQVWFEVAKREHQPFIVQKNNMRVEVLGTHFNVKAYNDDEEMKVTLVEGSVKVSNQTNMQVLKPGQQAKLFKKTNGIQLQEHADVEQAIAWKNGVFVFKNSSLDEILKDVEKWYDVEVVYEGGKRPDTYTGGINRTATLTELLSILEMSKVHFKLEGRKLIVLAK